MNGKVLFFILYWAEIVVLAILYFINKGPVSRGVGGMLGLGLIAAMIAAVAWDRKP